MTAIAIVCDSPRHGLYVVTSFAQAGGAWSEVRHPTRSGRRVRPRNSQVLDGDEYTDLPPAALRWVERHGAAEERAALAGHRERLRLRCAKCGAETPVRDRALLWPILDRMASLGISEISLDQIRRGLSF